MAGYRMKSFNWGDFEQFASDPSDQQLKLLANYVLSGLEDLSDEQEYGNLLKWPKEDNALKVMLKSRIQSDDWFANLNDGEKSEFDIMLRGFFADEGNGLSFEPEENEGPYWTVIDLLRDLLNAPQHGAGEQAISKFGTQPFRATLERGKIPGFETWAPYHSMHSPTEVKQMLTEAKSVEQGILNCDDDQAISDYELVLIPNLENLVETNRALYVELDT